MSIDALTLITYVWHYLVARLLYDQLLRPLVHVRIPIAALICGVAAAGFLIGRWTRRHRARRDQQLASRRRA
jgi:hypothetical protein